MTSTAIAETEQEDLLFPFRLVNVKQVAEWMGVSTYMIYQAIDSGELPAVKINSTYKIDYDKFIAWVDAGGSLSDQK